MSEHRYPRSVIRRDLFRAGAGVALTGGPLALASPGLWAGIVLGGLSVLFLAFGGIAILRGRQIVACNATEITFYGIKTVNLPWKSINGFDLRYYTVRKDRTQGWMQLILENTQSRLRIESPMEGFDGIVRQAAGAAQENGLSLSPATIANLEALNIKVVTPTGVGGAG